MKKYALMLSFLFPFSHYCRAGKNPDTKEKANNVDPIAQLMEELQTVSEKELIRVATKDGLHDFLEEKYPQQNEILRRDAKRKNEIEQAVSSLILKAEKSYTSQLRPVLKGFIKELKHKPKEQRRDTQFYLVDTTAIYLNSNQEEVAYINQLLFEEPGQQNPFYVAVSLIQAQNNEN